MSPVTSEEAFANLVRELCSLGSETECVEFKLNNSDPDGIGEYISALSNSAALCGKAFGYVVWGVDDETHALEGTDFHPDKKRVGNEEIENWLLRHTRPTIHIRFLEGVVDQRRVVVLEVGRAMHHPVRFKSHEFIRVGSYKKMLKEYPEKERELWRTFERVPFEACDAQDRLNDDDVLDRLDYPSYFELLSLPLPSSKDGILQALQDDELIRRRESSWSITNLGAILFAKRLADFDTVRRKAVRVVLYSGTSRVVTEKEQQGTRGYAAGFDRLISYINGLLPSNEVIHQALRRVVPVYPELAVRELVANMLLHQDFAVRGSGPMVEIFANRMEVSNPGAPLISPERFLDTPPKSRNELLASLMRRMGICEERGSGIDKVVHQTELYQLPAPRFELVDETTRAVLFTPIPLSKMDKDDRVRACYLHACLKYVNSEHLTNASVRARFGIDARNSAVASRLIKEAIEAGEIRPYDPNASKKYMKYVPWWAG